MNFKKFTLVFLTLLATSSSCFASNSDVSLFDNQSGDNYVFKNAGGTLVSDVYDHAYKLNDYLYAVSTKDSPSYAIYNITTNLNTEFIYQYISSSKDGEFIVLTNQEYEHGLMDKNGNVLIECSLQNITKFKNFYLCYKDKKLALYNTNTSTTGDYKYDSFDGFYEVRGNNLAIVESNLKFGVIDDTGSLITPINFDYIDSFSNGHASVAREKKFGVINNEGEIVVDLIYDDITISNKFVWIAKSNGKYGYINTKGKFIIEPKFDLVEPFSDFKNAVVVLDDKKGLINSFGAYIFDPIYEDVTPTDQNLFIVKDYDSKKYGVIDVDSNIIIDIKYDDIGLFAKDKLATITLGDTYALVDYKGRIITNFKQIKGSKPKMVINYDTIESFMSFDNNLMGLRDINGTIVLEAKYDFLSKTNDDLFLAYNNGKNGVINKSGEVLIPIIYDELSGFHGDNALALIDGKYSIISKSNKVVSDFKCDSYSYGNLTSDVSTFVFSASDKYGVADFKGNIIMEASDKKLQYLSDDNVAFYDNALWGVMDFDQNIIIDARFEHISKQYDSYIVFNNGLYNILDNKGNSISPFYKEFLNMTKKLYRFSTKNNALYGIYNVDSQSEVLSELYPIVYMLENKYNSDNNCIKIAFETNDPLRSNIGLVDTNGKVVITPGDYEFYFKSEDLVKYYDYDYKAGYYSVSSEAQIEPIYKSIGNYGEYDVTYIELDSTYALINKELSIITPFIFDHIGEFKDGYADIRIKSKNGKINTRGEYTLDN